VKYKIIIEYDGTNYAGWQRQKNKVTIQEVIEECIFKLSGEVTEVFVSGRTDSGVHALNQVAHFELVKEYEENTIVGALNFYLIGRNAELVREWQKKNNDFFMKPFLRQDIVIKDCSIVDDDFHARFSSKMRHYKYIILNRKEASALWQNRAWHIRKKLNIEKMQEAGNILLGNHDFSSFRDSQCQAKSPIKTLSNCSISGIDDDLIVFEFSAKSFLHHMIRNIVGTLRDVGSGRISVEEFRNIFEAIDRKKAGEMADACGLYLVKIDY
jgi:tRNA pseudouridine38-40 synthase